MLDLKLQRNVDRFVDLKNVCDRMVLSKSNSGNTCRENICLSQWMFVDSPKEAFVAIRLTQHGLSYCKFRAGNA